MKKIALFFSVIFFLFSCAKEEKPDYLWDEEIFVEVLVEVQLAEEMIRLSYNRIGDTIFNPDSIYASVFQKMEVSRVDYDSNYNYYMERPKKFEKLFEQVIVRLSEEAALVEKQKKSSTSKELKD